MRVQRTVTLRSGFSIQMVQAAGSDQKICEAARVSTLGERSVGTEESAGLINFLMKNRHGTPFEHGMITFRISAPIFVWREFMRHRIGFSYNEQSGRYMEMQPIFYMPAKQRPLVQVGKVGAYTFEAGTEEQWDICVEALRRAAQSSWDCYVEQLGAGIAKEVARMCLPVGIYSSAYVTCNPRSLMSFLSLRTRADDSTFPSYPQWEIEKVALQMEDIFLRLYPLTHAAFIKNGRVSP